MREVSELLFYLVAYPWFLICFLLVLSLVLIHTRFGLRCVFALERCFALVLLADLDVLRRSAKSRYEPETHEGGAVNDRLWFLYPDLFEDLWIRNLKSSFEAYTLPGSGVSDSPPSRRLPDEDVTCTRNRSLSL